MPKCQLTKNHTAFGQAEAWSRSRHIWCCVDMTHLLSCWQLFVHVSSENMLYGQTCLKNKLFDIVIAIVFINTVVVVVQILLLLAMSGKLSGKGAGSQLVDRVGLEIKRSGV